MGRTIPEQPTVRLHLSIPRQLRIRLELSILHTNGYSRVREKVPRADTIQSYSQLLSILQVLL